MRIGLLCAICAVAADASVIGHSVQGPPLTAERVRSVVPAQEQAAWLGYLQRSADAMLRDKAVLTSERSGLDRLPPLPSSSPGAKSMPLDKAGAWYGSVEARHIADVIVSFQTPSGGWGKNIDMTGPLRQRGQSFVSDNENKLSSPGDLDRAPDPAWHYVGTIDNDATVTQLRFLAKVQAAMGKDGDAYRTSFRRGVEYLLAAQFPNGGWPQVWPLEGGYHDALTFNDDALINVVQLFQQGSTGKGDYAFVRAPLKKRMDGAEALAMGCILKAQVVVDEKRTIWAQQYDPLTMQPVAARNYEPASLASGESSAVLLFLMEQPRMSDSQRAAVRDGVAWLRAHAIRGFEWTTDKKAEGGRRLIAHAGYGPIWARYYSMTTGLPVFGDRDLSIHDDVNEISLERRNGYGWYSAGPLAAVEKYGATQQ